MQPIVYYFSVATSADPIPFLTAEFTAANIWSMLLFVGGSQHTPRTHTSTRPALRTRLDQTCCQLFCSLSLVPCTALHCTARPLGGMTHACTPTHHVWAAEMHQLVGGQSVLLVEAVHWCCCKARVRTGNPWCHHVRSSLARSPRAVSLRSSPPLHSLSFPCHRSCTSSPQATPPTSLWLWPTASASLSTASGWPCQQ